MRMFEFKCRTCDTRYEERDRTSEIVCCGENVKRVYSIGGIQFKGSGFYSNDKKLDGK